MKDYKRLTDRDITKVCFDTWELCGLDDVCKRDCRKPEPCKIPRIIHRLAELEDKIENGTLVECIRKVERGKAKDIMKCKFYSDYICKYYERGLNI